MNYRGLRRYAMLVSALMVALLLGCNGGSKGPTGTVQGKLQLNGQPAPQGTAVQFLGSNGAGGGVVGNDGSFTVMGLPVGNYKVAISPAKTDTATSDSYGDDYEQQMMQSANKSQKTTEQPSQIPSKYQSVETSGISLEVQEGSNSFEYNMES